MAKSDYYDILGVSRKADDDAIKKAYRKLAREWHPDVNKSSEAPKKFAEIQEAYDVLSDPQKRKQYDRFGHVGVGSGAGGAGGPRSGGAGPGGFHYEWSGGAPGGGGNSGFDVGTIFEELFGGGGRRRGGGSPFGGAARPEPQQQITGQNISHTVTVPFEVAVRGGKESLRFTRGDQIEDIEITIPAGIADGGKLRIRGKGQLSPTGGKAGDLMLTVRIAPHPWFQRNGLDILIDVPVTISEAVLGASIEVPTVHGSVVTIKVPAGSSSGQKLRIPKQGIRKKDGSTGDFLAVLKVQTPGDLTEEDRKYFERLGQRTRSPRVGRPWQ